MRGSTIELVTTGHEDPSAVGARGRRRARAVAVPRIHRPPHALGAPQLRRSLPHAEARAGLHDRGDQPRRPRARARRPGPAGRAAGVPPAARRPGAEGVAVVDGRGVPRRARRDAARALARPLDRPRRGARRRARRRARRPHRGAGGGDASRGPPRPRRGRADAVVRARLPARAPSRRPASSSRSPRRRRGRACRSSRTFATRVTACSRRSRR